MHDRFLRACRRQAVDRTPVWIMRQAGRYLPEYRAVRERHDFLTMCRTPELAAQVTLQPIDRFGFDAAILFSDIMIPATPMGFDVTFDPGPVIANPVRTAADLARVVDADPGDGVGFVYETVRLLRGQLDGRAPLIGFAAAPFTLAAYLVEGRGSKNFERVKGLLYADPGTAHALLEKVARVTVHYLRGQIAAGAQAVQLFDSWGGQLDRAAYREFALRWARAVLDRLADAGVPRIYFALNAAHLYREIRDCGADVVGVDWRTPLDEADAALDGRYVLQGNLDPCTLFAPEMRLREEVRAVLERAAGLPGHVFNLGHGILPGTPVERVAALVDELRTAGRPA